MGEILGLGMTHTPPLMTQSNANRVVSMLEDPLLPEQLKDPRAWPAAMQAQWGTDRGQRRVEEERALLIRQMRWARAELEAFAPDVVIMWGDDQYENFKEDGVPAFAIDASDGFDVQPWAGRRGAANSWNEPADAAFHFAGHRAAGRYLATRLLEAGFDVQYAYKARHTVLPHAFLNTLLFLDWERTGLGFPVVPFAINCYGRSLLPLGGGGVNSLASAPDEFLDPPSPQPWRCFDLGRAVARCMQASPWRVALVASASWSHAFLSRRTHYFTPDVETDKKYLRALQSADWQTWRSLPLAEAEDCGLQELLNWVALAGAMAELGRAPDEVVFIESWLTNADKTFAVFRP
jgi:hypothetical protein